METDSASQSLRETLLAEHLATLFGDLSAATREFLVRNLRWTEIAAGDTLMKQGEPGDSAYLLVSGRLRVYVTDEHGNARMVRELGRGEVLGEMSLYTGEPRSATVVAVRDSVLARLDKPQFEALLEHHPRISIIFTREIIRRLQTERLRRPVPAPVTVGLVPVSAGVPLPQFAQRLAAELERHGRVRLVDAKEIDRALDRAGIARRDDAEAKERIAIALDGLEATHDFVVLVADAEPSAWTRHCIHYSDELLLLADASQPPRIHATETAFLADERERPEAAQVLVLLHPADLARPRNVRQWLAERPVAGHVNLRPELDRDMARLARLVSRKAIGLVLGGGGARGFAHLGIWRALNAHGVEIDYVGGTSVGAIMAALIAADPPVDEGIHLTRRAFRLNPTGDFNLLPMMSLIKGRRVRTIIANALDELAGGPIDIEDLWKGFFCIATNYSQAREHLLQSGDLSRALLASAAIPGALPPVVRDGDLLCDGGTFNNFPVDVMRDLRGIGTVIGSDLGGRNPRRLEFDDVPGSWTLLADRLLRKPRRYRLPSLASYLLNTTILYSVSRQQETQRLTDVYFNAPLNKVGLLQWSRFDEIVRQGEQYATAMLAELGDSALAALGLAKRPDAPTVAARV